MQTKKDQAQNHLQLALRPIIIKRSLIIPNCPLNLSSITFHLMLTIFLHSYLLDTIRKEELVLNLPRLKRISNQNFHRYLGSPEKQRLNLVQLGPDLHHLYPRSNHSQIGTYLGICIAGTRNKAFALLWIIESNNKCFMYHTNNCLFQLPFRLFLQDQNYYRIQWLE